MSLITPFWYIRYTDFTTVAANTAVATTSTTATTTPLVWVNVLSPCHNTQSPLANTSCLLTRLHIMKTKIRTGIFAFSTWPLDLPHKRMANFQTRLLRLRTEGPSMTGVEMAYEKVEKFVGT